ncbi:YraN family protein [Aneurinibacillus sp. BA2021]|nr:YraN family protein [Aneurinibacillus sp. BA2021]
MRKTNKQRGAEGEALARAYLEEKGYVWECSNFRVRTGEIDLVMRDGNWLVFIEVKTRTSTRYGHGSEAITPAKQRTIRQTALAYIKQKQGASAASPLRFDVVVLTYSHSSGEPEIWHLPHAF